ncbi:hypothetical protein FQR65_LT20035 [Abscondita terminalis]|nr:hypothetical protein FQR65_LT20035 [Abscondita terminalis]
MFKAPSNKPLDDFSLTKLEPMPPPFNYTTIPRKIPLTSPGCPWDQDMCPEVLQQTRSHGRQPAGRAGQPPAGPRPASRAMVPDPLDGEQQSSAERSRQGHQPPHLRRIVIPAMDAVQARSSTASPSACAVPLMDCKARGHPSRSGSPQAFPARCSAVAPAKYTIVGTLLVPGRPIAPTASAPTARSWLGWRLWKRYSGATLILRQTRLDGAHIELENCREKTHALVSCSLLRSKPPARVLTHRQAAGHCELLDRVGHPRRPQPPGAPHDGRRGPPHAAPGARGHRALFAGRPGAWPVEGCGAASGNPGSPAVPQPSSAAGQAGMKSARLIQFHAPPRWPASSGHSPFQLRGPLRCSAARGPGSSRPWPSRRDSFAQGGVGRHWALASISQDGEWPACATPAAANCSAAPAGAQQRCGRACRPAMSVQHAAFEARLAGRAPAHADRAAGALLWRVADGPAALLQQGGAAGSPGLPSRCAVGASWSTMRSGTAS